jgi:hypothetical protein
MKKTIIAILLVGCGGSEFQPSEAVGVVGPQDAGASSGGVAGRAPIDAGSETSSGGSEGGTPSIGGTAGSGGVPSTGGAAGTDGAVGGGGGGLASGGSSGSGGGSGGGSGECSTGAVQCVDAQRQTCISGLWLDNGAPCPGWCLESACTECRPGDRSCASDAQPQTCNVIGAWVADAACPQPEFCFDGACANLCCRGNVLTSHCTLENPFPCSNLSGWAGDCTDSSQCVEALGLGCIIPGAGTGIVEVCP